MGEQRELEEGIRGQPGTEPVAFLLCPNLSSPISAQQPGSFFPAAPPSGLTQLPLLPTSCGLPGFLLAHLQLPVSGKGASCAHPSLIWVFHPILSLPPPPAPLAVSGPFPPTEPLLESPAPPLPTQANSVLRCQLRSSPGPLEYYFS